MADPTAHTSDENKHEPDGTSLVGGLLRPNSNVRRESSTTSIKELLRGWSRGEDSRPAQLRVPETTVEVSSQESSGTRAKAGAVPFELQEPTISDPLTPYDLDIVAVHAYGEDRVSAWAANVLKPAKPSEKATILKKEESNNRQIYQATQLPATEAQARVVPSKVPLRPSAGLSASMVEKPSGSNLVGDATKAGDDEQKRTDAWVDSTLQDVPKSALEAALNDEANRPDEKIVYWLKDSHLFPGKFKKARVLLFYYCEPVEDGKPPLLQTIKQELAQRLEIAREDNPDRPIIFLGHDFGMTLIEATLVDLWKQGGSGMRICTATAGMVFFASESPASTKDDSRYFDAGVKGRLGRDPDQLPYQEIRQDRFLVQHLENFKSFTVWLAKRRPEVTLKCLEGTGKFATETDPTYCAFLKLIASIQDVYGLLAAVCAGSQQAVKAYLEKSRKPNIQNFSGQSALHLAVQHRQIGIIRLLVKAYNADASVCDVNGRTPLHLAIMHCADRQDIITTLIQGGADPNLKDKDGRSPRDLARSHKVDPAMLNHLVEGPSEDAFLEGVSDPIAPRLSFAVHACHDFHATLADFFLIDRKEKFFYEQPTVHELLYETGPDDILGAVRGPHVTESPRCRWIHLPANNVSWVEDLLAKMKLTIDSVAENQHEGPTPWSHYMRPQAQLIKPLKHVRNNGGRWTIADSPGRSYMLFMPYLNYEAACDQYSLYKVITEQPSLELQVLTLIEALPPMSYTRLKLDTAYTKQRQVCLILHSYLEELNDWNMAQNRCSCEWNRRLRRNPHRTNRGNVSVGSVFWYPLPRDDESPHSGDPSPHPSARGETRDGSPAANVLVPSERIQTDLGGELDQDNESYLVGRRTWTMKDEDRLSKERTLIKGYLYTSHSINSSTQEKIHLGPLHIRRTLDQSHYFMLTNTSYRDRHQVVLKEARKQSLGLTANEHGTVKSSTAEDLKEKEPTQADSEVYPMVMVDQLWLWVIGNTVISCFPQSWTQKNQKRDGDILDRLLHHLRTNKRRALIREPQDLVDVIVSYCAGVFNRPRSALGLDLHEHFETSVGRAADSEARLFHTFEKASAIDPTILMETEEGKKQLKKLYNIVPEVKLLEQTKDNVDELRMVLRIFNDQALVMTDLASILQKDSQKPSDQLTQSPQRLDSDISPHNITTTFTEGAAEGPIRSETISVAYKNRHPIIDANIRDFDRMLSHANASYEALNHLLDLKQKHATVTEARFAGNRADETARQGDTILFFTIVTIIFGSTSFVTAFFALNITSFPKDKNNATAWNLGHIAGIVAGVSVGLALPLVAIAFMIPTMKEYFQKRGRAGDKSTIPKQQESAIVLKTATDEGDNDEDTNEPDIPHPLRWQGLKSRFTGRPSTTQIATDHEKQMRRTLARTGQKFAYAGIGVGISSDQYINEAEADDPELASVNDASHEVDYSFLTRSR